jgi:hypothetical protein
MLVKSSFNYGELYLWVTSHLVIPEDKNEHFVLDSWFYINDLIPEASNFRLSISAKKLLEIFKLTTQICIDTTHKVIWQKKLTL